MLNLRTILCPTDFSACSAKAAAVAFDLAKQYAARLRLVTVIPEFDKYIAGVDMVLPVPDVTDATRRHADMQLDEVCRGFAGVTVDTEVRRGAVHASILAAAKDANADLIVMGTHGRTGIKHALLGSVAEHVVRLSPVPVLTVRQHA